LGNNSFKTSNCAKVKSVVYAIIKVKTIRLLIANRFYSEFRCGLLHEAATKGSSIIRTQKTEEPDKLIEKEKNSNNVILHRTPFQKALETYLEEYKIELMSSEILKKAFIRKMDDLCQIQN
jgi:hypothetical protein